MVSYYLIKVMGLGDTAGDSEDPSLKFCGGR